MIAIKITILGDPRTKKNSQRVIRQKGRTVVLQSKAFKQYENAARWQLLRQKPPKPIDYPVNVRCLYYMKTRRVVDLVNLQEATLDILVAAGVLADDNSRIVASMDGSRVLFDKDRPRVEIDIAKAREAGWFERLLNRLNARYDELRKMYGEYDQYTDGFGDAVCMVEDCENEKDEQA